MNVYTFHIEGVREYESLKINAIDETHAVNILLSLWLDNKPLATDGQYRLIHIEKGNN